MSVSRYLVRNSAVRLASFAIGICFTLVVTPIVVRAIGQANFGVWALIGSTIANYLLFDFGILQAVSKFIAAAKVRGDQEEINQICSSGVALNIVSCIFSLLVTLVLLAISRNSIPPGVDSSEAIFSFAVFGAHFSVLFLFRTWNGVLAAEMRWTLLAIIGMIKNILVSVITILYVSEEGGLLFLAVVNSVGFILEGLSHYYFARKSLRVQIRLSYMNYDMCAKLLKFGATSLFAQLGQSMRFRSQPYILVRSIGAEGVAVFSIVTQFIAHFNNLILSAFGVFIPWFSRLQASGDNDGIKRSLFSAMWLSYRVSSFIGLCLIFYGPTFVYLWLGPKFNDVRLALLPMVLGAILSTSLLPAEEFLIGISRHKLIAICNLCEGVLVILLSLFCVSLWGIAGVGWAYCLSSIIFRLCILPFYVYRKAEISYFYYLYLLLSVLVIHIFPQYLFWILVDGRFAVSYTYLAFVVAGQGLLAVAIQYVFFKFEVRYLRLLR